MSYWQVTGLKNSSLTPNNAEINLGRFLLKASLIASLVITSVNCSSAPGRTESPTEPSPTAETVTPYSNSVIRNDAVLSTAIDQLLDSNEYRTSRWGVAVVSLPDGKLLYGRNHDRLFTPASNMKIYTTAVALDMLGADYHWRTSVYADQQPDANGTINGDLVLYGRGAPDLLSENRKENHNSLDELAIALAARGVKRVSGNVVGDESYFRGEPIGDGWQQNDLQWYFGAEASALTVNANSVDISVTPTNKLSEPATVVVNDNGTGYVHTINNTVTVKSGERFRIGVQRALSTNDVVVWGDVPVGASGYGASLSVHQPSLWAANLFVRSLQKQGIAVTGTATSRNSRVPESQRFTPDGKVELASVDSQSLGEIAKITNKYSVNLYAELILRTLGRERGSTLGKETAQRERGDEEAGTELIMQWLTTKAGVNDRVAIHDGSGLSRLNLISPQSTAGLLAGISRTNAAVVFNDSLPIAGTDGTLQGRLSELKDRVKAKTGAIIYDNSLSGYLLTADGRWVAFSIISNDLVSHGSAIPLIDRLVLAMAKAGQTTPSTSSSPSRP